MVLTSAMRSYLSRGWRIPSESKKIPPPKGRELCEFDSEEFDMWLVENK